MTLQEYIKNIVEFSKENPDTLEMQVVTSKDDEGNGFNLVYYKPSRGIFESGDFIDEESISDWERDVSDINAVCVN